MESSLLPETDCLSSHQAPGSFTMSSPSLHAVASAVLCRAKRQGYVLPREIRLELKEAGQSTTLWKQVVSLLSASMKYRHGRYYAHAGSVTRLQHEQHQLQRVRDIVQDLIARYQTTRSADERRREGRAQFVKSVRIRTEDGQEQNVLVQDLSPSGVRLITDRSLLGRKVLLCLPRPQSMDGPIVVLTRILWSYEIADGLYKSGGVFLDLVAE